MEGLCAGTPGLGFLGMTLWLSEMTKYCIVIFVGPLSPHNEIL